MERIIETERLYLREFMIKDASALFKMSQNQKVLNNTFKNIEAAEAFIKNYNYENKIGIWVACGKRQGEFFGLCGLEKKHDNVKVDLTFHFSKKHRDKGLATEACQGVITYVFNVLRIQELNTLISETNYKAKNVLLKLNFTKNEKHQINNKQLYFLINNLINVRKINYKETYSIRQKVLRQGKPIESCHFEGDNEVSTFHLGLFYYGELIGITTLMKRSSKNIKNENQYQLRGMAILQKFQGKRFGELLLENAIEELKQREISVLWCNARINAVNFYSRFKFKKNSKSFNIENIGLHFQMEKQIT